METTKITANDIGRFITKAVEKNIVLEIVKNDKEYRVFTKNSSRNYVRIYIGDYREKDYFRKEKGDFNITIIQGNDVLQEIEFNITEKEYMQLALLCEDTIPYCISKSEESFFNFFGEPVNINLDDL